MTKLKGGTFLMFCQIIWILFLGNQAEIIPSMEKEIKRIKDKTNDPNWYDSFVISFSLSRDSLVMWNYYTKGNDLLGYNIEFDVAKLRKTIGLLKSDTKEKFDGIKARDGKVIYKLSDQKKLIYEVIRQFDNVNPNIKPYLIARKLWEIGRFIKKECFAHENEYRFLFSFIHDHTGKRTPASDEYHIMKGLLIPYQKAVFDKNAITGITCSPSLESEKAKLGVECLLRFSQYEGICNNIMMSEIPIRY